ncbi:hypothetical protein BDF14DRAFT_1809877 [Spinellus fusiger]|nr:hypothetical protein BDF14DRAFT_1809877 [Spinellus fusiger]
MTHIFSRTLFCLPKQQTVNEPNAFDLTWRNYLPSLTQFCPCVPFLSSQHSPIHLDPDDEPSSLDTHYYNDHTLYQGQAVRGYLDNAQDWEFDAVIDQDSMFAGENVPPFVTRNPFGKSKRKRSKRRKGSSLLNSNKHQPPAVYEIFSEDQDRADAESLGDDQIASLILQHKSVEYYEEECDMIPSYSRPRVQEMLPPNSNRRSIAHSGFHARMSHAQTISPYIYHGEDTEEGVEDTETENGEGYKDTLLTTAQPLMNGRMEDFTNKLTYIQHTMMNTTTGETSDAIATNNINNINTNNSTTVSPPHTLKPVSTLSNAERGMSDLDSIASETLEEYGNAMNAKPSSSQLTTSFHYGPRSQQNKTHSSDLSISLGDIHHASPFGTEEHPFSYYEDTSPDINEQSMSVRSSMTDTQGFNVQTMYELGKKWFGSAA